MGAGILKFWNLLNGVVSEFVSSIAVSLIENIDHEYKIYNPLA